MLENACESFIDDVYKFLTGQKRPEKCLLVKRHTENLQELGDFSFPNNLQSWHGHIDGNIVSEHKETFLQCTGKDNEDVLKESALWSLRVRKLEVNQRVHLFLERPIAIQLGLSHGLKNITTLTQKLLGNTTTVYSDPLSEKSNDLTSLRLKYLVQVIKNLSTVSGIKTNVFVTSKSSSKPPDGFKLVLCGTVLNEKTKNKETVISPDEYIRIRQNEMTLIAQHKYGVRVSTDSKWKDFLAHLGESAVIFELLQIKPSSPVKINFDCSSGSSKGVSFILYNCARLETIIRTYDDKVKEGVYPPLEPFESIDFSLLNQEDEWAIIFNYIMALPSILRNFVEINDKVCEFRPHQICSFLSSMVRVFSQFYRKTRILTEARKHMLPVLFARMHMLIVLNGVLKTCLGILNIKSVTQMYLCVIVFELRP